MLGERTKLIKDPIWGNIYLFPWEQRLTRHPIFARLHYIIQNSSAYKIYPGLRVSRYLHTLGVAHVASEVIQSVLTNSSQGVMRSKPSTLRHLEDEASEIASVFTEKERTVLVEKVKCKIRLTLKDGAPASESFACLAAGLRMAALTHDIGHLPYSHTAEFALGKLTLEDFSWNDRGKAKKSKKLIKSLVEESPGGKIHEALGKKLISLLVSVFEGKRDPFSKILSKMLDIAHDILHSDRFLICRSFISGTVDVDRIDFVKRDTESSGLLNSSVDYGRLFSFYQLHLHPVNGFRKHLGSEPGFIAYPSSRASSDIEKLLWERFQDYKYIVCHHRVLLHDELIERCLVELIASGRIRDFVECLNQVIGDAGNHEIDSELVGGKQVLSKLVGLFTAFDDPWLEMQLRRVYVEILLNSRGSDGNPETSRLGQLLIATVEDANTLESAFHSDDTFWEYAAKCSAGLRDVVSLPTAERAVRVRQIATQVNECKYQWEKELYEHYGLVVIGEISNKLKVGISGPRFAESLGMVALETFLVSKIADSGIFNFWFPANGATSTKEGVMKFICAKLFPQKEFWHQKDGGDNSHSAIG